MNRICLWLTERVSRTLESEERIAVHGDLVESGFSGAAVLLEVLGLVIRRQLALWRTWQPWLALLGVAVVSAVVLSATAFNLRIGIDHRLMRYLKNGSYHAEQGVPIRQELVFMLCLSVALFAWTWTSSFVLAMLSRRALWLTGLMFYVVVLSSFLARLVVSGAISTDSPIVGDRTYPLPVVFLVFLLPFSPSKLLFLIAAVWGARSGLRKRVLGLWPAVTLAISVVIATVLVIWTGGWYEETHSLILPWVGTSREAWSGGVWHAGPWPTRLLPMLLVSWPVGYILATSWRRRNELSVPSGGFSR